MILTSNVGRELQGKTIFGIVGGCNRVTQARLTVCYCLEEGLMGLTSLKDIGTIGTLDLENIGKDIGDIH